MNDLQTTIQHVNGFHAAGIHCGLKKNNALDVALIISEQPCTAAGVFTTNKVKAATLLVDMERLQQHGDHIRAVAINTISANACTGQQGIDNAYAMAKHTAGRIGCSEEEVLVLSTGVIGTQLPMAKIRQGIDLAAESLADDWQAAATAIMTTDTRPKLASITVQTADGVSYQIAGIAKGSGMIAPNMATMLSVIVTDAALTTEQTQSTLQSAANISYNRIVVDGDMSTNDTVFLLANGTSAISLESDQDIAQFQEALNTLTIQLAQAIVRDGEGVSKFITLDISGTSDQETARQIAHTIATSALVKTAFYGNDANWGRIIAAAGRAGVTFEPEQAQLWVNGGEELDPHALLLFQNGMPTDYSEEAATAIMHESSIYVHLDCGSGEGTAQVWTCDLSHDYVSINADYRT